MQVIIDEHSGFCFGVINAIRTAESYLKDHHSLYCLGDIVHNNEEVKRLAGLGLVVISHEQYTQLQNTTVLIRAHGEPPEIYEIAERNHIELIDATCPVVLNLQKRIKQKFETSSPEHTQILIFGKQGHAEVVGLLGQTGQQGVVLSSMEDVQRIDFNKSATLYSQTTQSLEQYDLLIQNIKEEYKKRGKEELLENHDTICRLVANRSQQVRNFAMQYDKVIFVSGEKSSNGLYLFGLCKEANPQTYFLSHIEQLDNLPVSEHDSIGICGATSTPMWLMQEVQSTLLQSKQGL